MILTTLIFSIVAHGQSPISHAARAGRPEPRDSESYELYGPISHRDRAHSDPPREVAPEVKARMEEAGRRAEAALRKELWSKWRATLAKGLSCSEFRVLREENKATLLKSAEGSARDLGFQADLFQPLENCLQENEPKVNWRGLAKRMGLCGPEIDISSCLYGSMDLQSSISRASGFYPAYTPPTSVAGDVDGAR